MSNPAGWYPQPDGQQRYFDGQVWTENYAPGVAPAAPAAPARPWFKKKRFILPTAALAVLVLASAMSGGGSTGTPIPQAPAAAVAPAAPTTDAPAAVAPAPVAVATTCDVVKEALLTGTSSSIKAAMKHLQADKSADGTAREYASYYLVRDAGNKQLREMDVNLIQMSCG